MPKFIVQFQGQESVAELKAGANSIGRQSTCTIPLKDSTLSRLHCEVILAGTVATLVDKGSRNGTLLNGKKTEAQVLQPGDKVQIGATTLWYEKKNIARETATLPRAASVSEPGAATEVPARRPAAPPAAAPSPGTARRVQGEAPRKPPTAAVRPPAPRQAPTDPVLADYVFHGKAAANTGKIIAAVIVIGVLGGGGYYGRGLLTLPAAPDVDLDNIVRNPHFDILSKDGKPDGWAMRPNLGGGKSSCTVGVDPERGRNKSPCLVLEKSAGTGELQAECACQDDFAIARGSTLVASAWVQADNFGGWAALKIDWLRSAKSAVIAEECSDLLKPSGWAELKGTFTAPPGAGACRLSLAILGRSGKVFFDDVSLKPRAGGVSVGGEKKLGPYHKVSYTRGGVLGIEMRGGRRSLSNITLRLESEKEGMTTQPYSMDVSSSADENELRFEGKVVSPLDFRDLAFQERAYLNDGETTVEYHFKGDALKQVDRVTIGFTLPRVDGPPAGIPEGGEPTVLIKCSSEDGDFAIEYGDPAVVTYRNADGRFRIFQTWKVAPDQDEPTFAFKIHEAGGNRPLDPWAAIVEYKRDRKYGAALTLAKDQQKVLKEAQAREKMDAEVRGLEELERREWAETQAVVFQADISRRSELVTQAQSALDTYARQWKGGDGLESKAGALGRDLEGKLKAGGMADSEYPKRVLERAKKSMDAGKRSLAQALLQTLVSRYPSSEAAIQATEMLKTLNQ